MARLDSLRVSRRSSWRDGNSASADINDRLELPRLILFSPEDMFPLLLPDLDIRRSGALPALFIKDRVDPLRDIRMSSSINDLLDPFLPSFCVEVLRRNRGLGCFAASDSAPEASSAANAASRSRFFLSRSREFILRSDAVLDIRR